MCVFVVWSRDRVIFFVFSGVEDFLGEVLGL